MRFRPSCLAVMLAAAAMAGPASAQDCAPAWIDGDPGALPVAWRRALITLVDATAREGQPWSCTGARLSILPPSNHGFAQLEIEDSSGMRRRPVAAPADVLPLGEAMLAKIVVIGPPLPPPPAPPPPPPAPPVAEAAPVLPRPFAPPPDLEPLSYDGAASGPKPRAGDAGPGEPWEGPARHHGGHHTRAVLFDALAGARYTGPTRALMLGAELRGTVVFGRWSAGLSARYDTAVDVFQPVPDQFSLSSVSVAIPVGYRLVRRPVELTASLEPALAVVMMGAAEHGDGEPDVHAHVDMRLGARLGMAIPVSQRLRVVCALGGEGVPAALFGDDRHTHPHLLPDLPAYLAGLSVGMEASVLQ